MAETQKKNDVALTFYGAAGTVTGSKHRICFNHEKILLDAGLFQGLKSLRLRNWETPPFDPVRLDAVVLSHAHIDHSGYLPALVKHKFRHDIFCTSGTAALLDIMLKDSAKLQEEDARYANKKGYSKHNPALPLYTSEDVRETLKHLKPKSFNKEFKVTGNITANFRYAGHILGAAIVELKLSKKNPLKLVFSGDLGRWNQPLIKDPEFVQEADVLMLESTYGDRIHPEHPQDELARVINETVKKKGVLIIPAFAVGRTQELVWIIRELEEKKLIPVVHVFVDSPMATEVTELYHQCEDEFDDKTKEMLQRGLTPIETEKFKLISDYEDSKKLNRISGPMVIISSSGMLTGGRVLHHLEDRIDDTRTTVLLAGYQAAGTRGRRLKEGEMTLKFYGRSVPVKAKIECIDGLSAHADQNEIFRWLKGFKRPPKKTYIVHGEPDSAKVLADKISQDLNWDVAVATDGQSVDLGFAKK